MKIKTEKRISRFLKYMNTLIGIMSAFYAIGGYISENFAQSAIMLIISCFAFTVRDEATEHLEELDILKELIK